MKFKALTIAREYGSGGGEVARIAAERLGWKLLDKDLLTEIGNKANVAQSEVTALDEQVDPWLHRITRPLWGSGVEGFSAMVAVNLFDADKAAAIAKLVIEEAYRVGNCVIVGRGAQCVLKDKVDVFKAFVYAGWADRVHRLQGRVPPGTHVGNLIRSMDAARLEYVQRHYGVNRLDPHLYHLMVNSNNDPEAAARLILAAMQPVG